MMVSFYTKANDVTSQDTREIGAVLAGIRAGQWDAQVLPVRALYPGDEYDMRKKTEIPGFTVSGVFSRREDNLLVQHSQLLAMDIDRSKNPDLNIAQARAKLQADSYVYACFLSLSGDGLAVFYRVPGDNHRGSWRALKQYLWQTFGLVVDKACPNESRLRFVSSDPALYLNEASVTFEETLEEERPKVAPRAERPEIAGGYAPRSDYGQIVIERARKLIFDAGEGDKHYGLRDASFLCGGYIASGYVNEAQAFDALLDALRTKPDVRDWKVAEATIRSGFRKGALKPLLPTAQQRVVRRQASEGQPREAIVAGLSLCDGIAAQHLEAAVLAVLDTPNPTIGTFWKQIPGAKHDSYKLVVDRVKLREWLMEEGFCFRPDGEKVEFLRVVNNVVKRVERYTVQQHVFEYVEGLPARFDNIEREDLLDVLLTQITSLFHKQVLECLHMLQGEFVRDPANAAYFFFRNCWVEVTATDIMPKPYAQLPGLIWESQVKNRSFFVLDRLSAQTCDFHQFMHNVTAKDPARLALLQKALGYLLHGYKDASNTKCIILVDEVATSGKPDGRTGKSLLVEAVKQLIHVTQIAGATFRFDDAFRFQRIQDDTRIAYFDEWDSRRNQFKKLFTEIVSDIAVNRKNKAEVSIPFKQAPKFVITTNDVVSGEGSSHEGRKIEIPLAPHYSAKHTPRDEFGTGFFEEGWDKDEYARFDNLALLWVQDFLASGRQLVPLQSEAFEARRLEDATSPEFVEWVADLQGQRGDFSGNMNDTALYLWTEPLYEAFLIYSGESKQRFSMRKFYQWMSRVGYERKQYKRGGVNENKPYFQKAE